MKLYGYGSCNRRVSLSKRDVETFAARWPGFGPCRAMSFEFASNGDIVDVTGNMGMDESGVLALSYDAQAYAVRRDASLRDKWHWDVRKQR